MTLFNVKSWFTPRPKERRKNRDGNVTASRHAINNATMHRVLVEISNKTRTQMDDAQFRAWAQDEAHFVIELIGRTSK